MIGRIVAAGLALACWLGAIAPALADCKFMKVSDFEVSFTRNRPLIDGVINDEPVKMLFDTGSVQSLLWRAQAEKLGLRALGIDGMRMVGVGGTSKAALARIRELRFGGFKSKNIHVLVTGEGERDFGFLIGQDVFSRFEVEFDLGNRRISLFIADGCGDRPLAYWTREWLEADLVRAPEQDVGKPQYTTRVKLNGVSVPAIFDTGAPTSAVTLQAARRAGVTPDTPGTVPLGQGGGLGEHQVDEWGAVFDSFELGGETIRNAKIRIADLFGHARRQGYWVPEHMMLGADFFQAHRVLISARQRKVYFTHNGGPVFQVVHSVKEDDDLPDTPPAESSSR
jgi:predicted aspartyl protease